MKAGLIDENTLTLFFKIFRKYMDNLLIGNNRFEKNILDVDAIFPT